MSGSHYPRCLPGAKTRGLPGVKTRGLPVPKGTMAVVYLLREFVSTCYQDRLTLLGKGGDLGKDTVFAVVNK